MRYIRFGTYSKTIKTLDAKSLNLPEEHNNYVFKVMQKVFHLWYIPIFPVDKYWKIADRHTGKEAIPEDPIVRNAINLRTLKTKTPLWAYTGTGILLIPVLLLLGLIIYWAADSSIAGTNKFIAKENRKADKEAFANAPLLDDLYTFKVKELEPVTDYNGQSAGYQESYWKGTDIIAYTVNYISKDSLGLSLHNDDDYFNSRFPPKQEIRIARHSLLKATKGFRDLPFYEIKYPDNPNPNKLVSGIFKITRDEEVE